MTGELSVEPGRLWVVPTAVSLHSRSRALDVSPATRNTWEQLRARVLYGGPADHFPPPVIPFDRKAPAMRPVCNPSACATPLICALPGPRAGCTRPAPAPEFDSRLTNGARVKLQHKTRDEVHELTARVIVRNGGRIIGVRPSAEGHRYDAADYNLIILAPALPTEPGLYIANGSDSDIVYRLSEAGGWTRWETSRTILESTTAYSVGREVGPDGLVELVAASS